AHHLDLLSFPTRRSSDLLAEVLPEALEAVRIDRDLHLLGLTQVDQPRLHLVGPGLPLGSRVERVALHLLLVLVAVAAGLPVDQRSEEHTSELQSRENLVC